MVTRTILLTISKIQFPLFWLYFILAAGEMLFNIIYLLLSKPKDIIKEYFSDKVALLWPFIVFSPSVILLIFSLKSDKVIDSHFLKMGVDFFSLYSTPNWILDLIGSGILIASLIIVLRSRKRIFENHNNKTWLTKPKGLLWTRKMTFVLMATLCIMTAAIFILYQWVVFLFFLNSSWIPIETFSGDLSYGLNWIKEILNFDFSILTIMSFSTITLTIREHKYGEISSYKRGFIVSFSTLIVFAIILILSYNNFLDKIQTNLLNDLLDRINQISHPNSLFGQIKQLTYGVEFFEIIQKPDKQSIISWLDIIIGARLIPIVISLVDKITDGKLNIPEGFKDQFLIKPEGE